MPHLKDQVPMPNTTHSMSETTYTFWVHINIMNHNENVLVALSDPRCLRNSTNSTQWINRNFGPFVQSALLTELVELNRNFAAVSVKCCNLCKIPHGKKHQPL